MRAAAAHEQAALLAGDGNGEAHQDAAEHHREEARRHEAARVSELEREEEDFRRES